MMNLELLEIAKDYTNYMNEVNNNCFTKLENLDSIYTMYQQFNEYLEENKELLELDREELEEKLNDDLWINDSVTGNASGSYTFCRETAKEYVTDNMDLVQEVVNEFCISADTVAEKFLNEDYEYFDVSIRCYLLGATIAEVLDETF